MKEKEADFIAVEEIVLSSAWNFFLPHCTGRTGYLHKKFVPEILHGQKVIQVPNSVFEKLKPNMENVNDITLR